MNEKRERASEKIKGNKNGKRGKRERKKGKKKKGVVKTGGKRVGRGGAEDRTGRKWGTSSRRTFMSRESTT